MATDLTTYYQNLDKQKKQLEKAAYLLQVQIPDGEDAELAETDYSGIAYQLNSMILINERLQKIHKFYRMSREQFTAYATNGKMVSYITHEVKSYETIYDVAELYGVTIDDILLSNNITTGEFEEQTTIQIPRISSIVTGIRIDIPTYGNQDGINILGTDVDQNGTVYNGDLKVLSEIDTFYQGVSILTTTEKGTVPLDPTFGSVPEIGKEYPTEAINNMIMIGVLNGLSQDPRIADVQSITVTTQDATSKTIQCDAVPINIEQFKKELEQ